MQFSEGCDENRNLVYIGGIVRSNESSCMAHRIEVPKTGRVKKSPSSSSPQIAWLWHLRQIEALFDLTECWEKLGTKRRYFAADHEQTINNLRRTRFFPQPTTFNQGTHFIGLRWPPQLRLNFCTQPTSRSTKPAGLQTPVFPNILRIRRGPCILFASNVWKWPPD